MPLRTDRLKISEPPLLTMACHCTGCQRMSASAFSLTAAIPTAGLEIIKGETVIGGLHGPDRHHFCPHCKSWMFTKPGALDWFVNLRPTMLEDAQWFAPFIETYTSEKLPWATTSAVHSFEKFPTFDAYEGLIKEFAAQPQKA
jgi:hypothetical protein